MNNEEVKGEMDEEAGKEMNGEIKKTAEAS